MSLDADNNMLPVLQAAELAQATAQHRWLIEPLWAHNAVGIIGGAPKCCKSWLGLDIALSVASGTRCLGRFSTCTSAAVLLYLAEDAHTVVKTRLSGLCYRRGLCLQNLPINVITAPALRLDLKRDQDRLANTVEHLRPALLLLDPFVRLHRLDENHAGDVSALLAYLRQLQRSFDTAVLVVHHTRKNGPRGSQAGQGLRGSSDFHAWGDSNLYLQRKHEHLVLTIEHRAAQAPPPVSLVLDGDDESASLQVFETDEPSPQCRQDLHIERQVLAALKDAAQPLSRSELRDQLRVRNQRLGDALQRLAADAQIHRLGDRWALPSTPVYPFPDSPIKDSHGTGTPPELVLTSPTPKHRSQTGTMSRG